MKNDKTASALRKLKLYHSEETFATSEIILQYMEPLILI